MGYGETVPQSPLPDILRHEIVARGRRRILRRGDVIIESGGTDRDVYYILEGRMEVTLLSARGQNVIIRDIGPGGLFGEFAALSGRPRSASVSASQDSKIVEITDEIFLQIVAETAGAGLWLARQFAEEVRRLTQRHFEMSTMAVTARIQCELLHLASKAGIRGDCAQLDPAPTHASIAARIGSHREAVTKEFGQLARLGIITQDKRSLTIRSISGLIGQIQHASGEDMSGGALLFG
jgi:CRP-like cAMP-binding protein